MVLPAIGALGLNGVCILGSVTAGAKKTEVDVAAFNQSMVLGNRVVIGTVNAAIRHFEAAARDLATAQGPVPRLAGADDHAPPAREGRAPGLRARAGGHQVRPRFD
jgi:hypothetical protein